VSAWTATQIEARNLLSELGDVALKEIYGDGYAALLGAVQATRASGATASTPSVTTQGPPRTNSGKTTGLMAAVRAGQTQTQPTAVAASMTSTTSGQGPVSATVLAANQPSAIHPLQQSVVLQPTTTSTADQHQVIVSHAPHTSSKRKMVDTIDLCTPSPEPKRVK
jgi:hypothetical protein